MEGFSRESSSGCQKQWFYSDICLGATAGLAQPGEELKFC